MSFSGFGWMDVITDDDIRRTVSQGAFDAGLECQLEGRVLDIRPSSVGSTFEAEVMGGGRSRYRQSIRLSRAPNGKLLVSGSCTCPVGFNCKHVAAVLFECQDQLASDKTLAALLPLQPGLPFAEDPGRLTGAGTVAPRVPPADAPLPHEVDAWLRNLHAAHEEESEDYPPSVRKRLLYVLERGAYSGGLVVNLQSIELKRDGTPRPTVKVYKADQLMRPGQQPKFLRPSDRFIVRRPGALDAQDSEDVVPTLRSIIATGRGRWAKIDGPTLTEGAPVSGELTWTMAEDGRQRAALDLPAPLVALRLASPWYVDPASGALGPVETKLPARLIRAMLASPALLPATANRVHEEMARRWPESRLPTPKPLAPPQVLRHTLQPHLVLLGGDLPFDPTAVAARRYPPPPSTASHRVALARLSWRYGPISLPLGAYSQAESVVQHGGTLFDVVRDRRAEVAAAEQAIDLGFGLISHVYPLSPSHPHARDMVLMDPAPEAWIEFMLMDVPRLRAEGWLVETADDFPLRLVEPSGGISFSVRERSGIDWFDLDLGVMVDGIRVSLLPALMDAMAITGLEALTGVGTASDDAALPLLLPLSDGRLLTVPLAQLEPILAPLLELFTGAEIDEQAGTLRLLRHNTGDLALLEAASTEAGIAAWAGGEAVRALGRQLREQGGIPHCRAPDGFVATLRPYQEHGLSWLQFLGSAGLGGVLADDMGLGKTVQTLAHLAVEQAAGRLDLPALVVCPTSLVPNWQAEAARFAPSLRTLVLHGPHRAERFGSIGQHDLVITTYPLLARDQAVLTAHDWHLVVLDEAQMIKNPLAATSKLARTLRARQRLCLSGTPLENHLGELWSLFDFLLPGFLGDRKQFGWRYRGPIEKAGNIERQALLAQRIAPFLLRRTKEQVASDLPPKTEITETVEMGDGQRAIYEGIRLAMHAKVRAAIAKRGMAGSGIIILDALLKLRQACCDPRLVKLATAKTAKAGSAKLERLSELLPQMLEEGRRVLLFSQFTSMLVLIEAELTRFKLPYVMLTGDTRDRVVPVQQFQAGAVPLFLISLKAGGVGLNLTAADTVIHYDPWWNPAVEEQATDRAHRIGQDKPVFVHRLITAGTIEEKMAVLKQRKQALAEGVLGANTESAMALTEGDLDMLFAPIKGGSQQ